MFKVSEIAIATTARAALLVAGINFEEADSAYDITVGHFMVDGMRKVAYGIYYTVEHTAGKTRYFVSFDGDVEGWRDIAPEGSIQDDWGFRDLR